MAEPATRKPRAKGNGNGTVWEKGPGKWRWEVTVGFSATGKRSRRSGTCNTKREAEKAARGALTAKDEGRLTAPDKMTLEAWLGQWCERREGVVAPKTMFNQRDLIRLHILPTLGEIRLQSISKKHVQDLYSSFNKPTHGKNKDKPLGPSMQRQIHNILRPALQEALKLDLISRNPALEIKPTPLTKSVLKVAETDVWTLEEALRFIGAARADRYGYIFEFMLLTGTRKGEALGLRWANVNFEARQLTISEARGSINGKAQTGNTKTESSTRRIPLSPDVLGLLERVRVQQAQDAALFRKTYQDSGYVFTFERTGQPTHPENLARSLGRIIKAAQIKRITVHGIRHTHASLALAQSNKPEVVSRQLGHKRTSFTLDVYRTVYESERQDYALELGVLEPEITPRAALN